MYDCVFSLSTYNGSKFTNLEANFHLKNKMDFVDGKKKKLSLYMLSKATIYSDICFHVLNQHSKITKKSMEPPLVFKGLRLSLFFLSNLIDDLLSFYLHSVSY